MKKAPIYWKIDVIWNHLDWPFNTSQLQFRICERKIMSILLDSCNDEIVYNKCKVPCMISFSLFLLGAPFNSCIHSLNEHGDPQFNKIWSCSRKQIISIQWVKCYNRNMHRVLWNTEMSHRNSGPCSWVKG